MEIGQKPFVQVKESREKRLKDLDEQRRAQVMQKDARSKALEMIQQVFLSFFNISDFILYFKSFVVYGLYEKEKV